MSSLGQRGSVGQKVSIAGFLDRVGHLGGVDSSNSDRSNSDRSNCDSSNSGSSK